MPARQLECAACETEKGCVKCSDGLSLRVRHISTSPGDCSVPLHMTQKPESCEETGKEACDDLDTLRRVWAQDS